MKYLLKKQIIKNQKGVALFQVLLIITILMFLAIFVTNKAKLQVDSAKLIADKQAAMLAVRTTLSKIQFNLLVYPADVLFDQHRWNFYGKEFLLDQVKVKIQDHNGLLSISKQTPLNRVNAIVALANKEGDVDNPISVNAFTGWFSQPDNLRIQNLEQFISMGFSWPAASKLWSYITVNPRILFNPANPPEELLPIYFNSAQAEQISAVRSGRQSYSETRKAVQDISGLSSDETVGYITGPYYRVSISAKIGESHWNMLYELSIVQQHNGLNITILSQRPF